MSYATKLYQTYKFEIVQNKNQNKIAYYNQTIIHLIDFHASSTKREF
jgi:hypothetical protein